MPYRRRIVQSIAIAALVVAAAIGGFAIGHHTSTKAAPPWLTAFASEPQFSVNYPPDWAPVAAVARIPGLTLAGAIALAPRGHANDAGLIAGALVGSGADPLPATLAARLRGVPQTDVVTASSGVQALRYSQLRVDGYGGELTLYAIPNPNGRVPGIACYAATPFAAYLRTCERIVATVAVGPDVAPADLTPDAGYAHGLSLVIAQLDTARASGRAQLSGRPTSGQLAAAASRLAQAFGAATAALAGLHTPPAALTQQIALSTALGEAQSAYAALATAARARQSSAFAQARQHVYGAEAQVDGALAALVALGYGHG